MEFQPFPKMARLSREVIITEKLDGTNAQIVICDGASAWDVDPSLILARNPVADEFLLAGSRNRWLSPGKATKTTPGDNYGFAGWVQRNAEELFKLGPGRHFGEWWGQGIQSGYGLSEKRFSLFNTQRWVHHTSAYAREGQTPAPTCCHVVPVLYEGLFTTHAVEQCLIRLTEGSVAAPGFMDPEGVIIYHTAAKIGFKKTIKGDESYKSAKA
jgi:hypothetical protein